MGEAARRLESGWTPRDARPSDRGPEFVAPATAAYELDVGAAPLLRDAPAVRALLDEAIAVLRDVFGGGSEFIVRRFDDPEAAESTPSLPMLFVRTALSSAAAHALLERFDEAWWFDNALRGDGKLEVSLEFV